MKGDQESIDEDGENELIYLSSFFSCLNKVLIAGLVVLRTSLLVLYSLKRIVVFTVFASFRTKLLRCQYTVSSLNKMKTVIKIRRVNTTTLERQRGVGVVVVVVMEDDDEQMMRSVIKCNWCVLLCVIEVFILCKHIVLLFNYSLLSIINNFYQNNVITL